MTIISRASLPDPLPGFAWETLHPRYDDLCRRSGRFNPDSEMLAIFGDRPGTDRELYYRLADTMDGGLARHGERAAGYYRAMVYWKLYSQHRVSFENYRALPAKPILRLAAELPASLPRNVDAIMQAIDLGEFSVYGMQTKDALPMRTTLLHFHYPAVVPIFDAMVLRALGINNKSANHDRATLRRYLPFVWQLGEKYTKHLAARETSVRLVEMALWVIRHNDTSAGRC